MKQIAPHSGQFNRIRARPTPTEDGEMEPAANTDTLSATTATILLVDDDEEWLQLATTLLEDVERFRVETATSVASSRKQIQTTAYDCIVCDYQLQDGTGLDLLDELRNDQTETPFVLVTSRGDEFVAAEAIRRGVTDYFPKQVIVSDLDETQNSALITQLKEIIAAHRREQVLRREQELKTTALDLLTTMTNHEQLHRQFCGLLCAEYGYDGAWIGTLRSGGRLIPRAISGCETYLNELDPTAAGSFSQDEPALRAVDQNQVAVSSTAESAVTEPWYEAWQQRTDAFEFESGIGVPLGDDRNQIGVLGVYSSEPQIGADERALLREFAQIITHNLRSDEWEASLVRENPVVLEFEITAASDPLIELAAALPPEATMTVSLVAEHETDKIRYTVEFSGVDPAACRSFVEANDHISLGEVTETVDGHSCDFIVEGPTPERIARTYGLQFHNIEVTSEKRTVVGYLPTDSALPNLLADMRSTFHNTTVTKLSEAASETQLDSNAAGLLEPLTNRQREVLSNAVVEGYFEQPRGISATELAEKFGLSRSTVTQHLRSGQQKIIEQLFTGGENDD